MKTKKVKGIPCSNMKEFDAVMNGVDSHPAHTPPPWKAEGTVIKGPVMLNGSFNTIAKMFTDDREDAAFIVRAVNSHEELLELAKEYQRYIQMKEKRISVDIAGIIAKAEGK